MTKPQTPTIARASGCISLVKDGEKTHCLAVATWPDFIDRLMDPDRLLTYCPACGEGGPVDRATYGKALRADAAWLRSESEDPEDHAKADQWDERAEVLDPDPRQTSLFPEPEK